jgi:hypothetical protein
VFVTNHVLAGAVIGNRYADRPMTAFLVGIGSHLAMDAVPHWGCAIDATDGPERFYAAARRDGLLGLAAVGGAVLGADPRCRFATVAAIAGSVLLDLDKPVEHFFGIALFPDLVQRVHGRIQNESDDRMPAEVAGGVLLALADLWVNRRSRRDAGGQRPHLEPSAPCSSTVRSASPSPS